MKKMNLLFVFAGLVVASSSGYAQYSQMWACYACHGNLGQSYNPNFPKLAGQQQVYLVNTLTALKSHARGDADAVNYMWGMAKPLTTDDINNIATFLSQQAPGPKNSPGDATKIAAGKDIFTNGLLNVGVPACAGCHGADALGNGAFPRLAGQFKYYLTAQLKAFRDGTRTEDPTMPVFAKVMSDQQIDDVTEYLDSL